jgi:MatE
MVTMTRSAYVLVTMVYLAAPGIVPRPFLDPAEGTALGIATSLLVIAALMQFFDCAQNIGIGLLRGVDDTKSRFRLTVIGYWLVGLPAAALLGWRPGWAGGGLARLDVRLGRHRRAAAAPLHHYSGAATSTKTHVVAADPGLATGSPSVSAATSRRLS